MGLLSYILERVRMTLKEHNPLSPRFVFWYMIALIVVALAIVVVRVAPVIQADLALRKSLQNREVYIEGLNQAYTPKSEDFLLTDQGGFEAQRHFTLREPPQKWEQATVDKYWNPVDRQKLKELSQNNREKLRKRLDSLP